MADGDHTGAFALVSLFAPEPAPITIVTVEPDSVIVEPLKVKPAPPVKSPCELTVPSGRAAVFAEFHTSSRSLVALSMILTVTEVADPDQLARIELAATASLYVKVIVSPASGLPAIEPPSVAPNELAVGGVVSGGTVVVGGSVVVVVGGSVFVVVGGRVVVVGTVVVVVVGGTLPAVIDHFDVR